MQANAAIPITPKPEYAVIKKPSNKRYAVSQQSQREPITPKKGSELKKSLPFLLLYRPITIEMSYCTKFIENI